jgi:probable HAF family extracellular repeat protein
MEEEPMTRRALASALALTLLAGVVIASSSTPSYTLTDLGPGHPMAISAVGSVVGSRPDANGVDRAFLWTSVTGQTDLGIADSYATGVNADGVVVGVRYSAGVSHAFRWRDGVATDLGTLSGFASSTAAGVNASGQVVGNCTDDTGSVSRAFLWQSGTMTDLGTLPGFTSTTAVAVNVSGQVIGVCTNSDAGPFTRAFLWQAGTMTDLGTLGGSYTTANAISDSGVVVGASYLDDDVTERAFAWDASNGMRDLGAVEGNECSVATGVNDAGQAVGWSFPMVATWDPDYGWYVGYGPGTATLWSGGDASALAGPDSYAANVNNATAAHGTQVVGEVLGDCGEYVAFVWEIDAGGQLTARALSESLNAAFTGSLYEYPNAINDAGQIALPGQTSSLASRAFLLSPSTLPPVEQALLAPSYVAATAGAERVALTWSTVCCAESYVVKRGTVNGGPYQTIASGLTSAQYADTSAPLGSTYRYVVAAVKGTTVGASSAEIVAAPLPYAPIGLTAKVGTGRAKTQASLKWTASASSNIAHYKVYRTSSTGPVLVATLGTATSWTVTGLSSRTAYSFYVTAVHAGGQESFASNVASVTTK